MKPPTILTGCLKIAREPFVDLAQVVQNVENRVVLSGA